MRFEELHDELSADEEASQNFTDAIHDVVGAIDAKDKEGAEAALAQATHYAEQLQEGSKEDAMQQIAKYRERVSQEIF